MVGQTMNFHPQYYVDVSSVMPEAVELLGRYVCQNGARLAEGKKARLAAHGRRSPRPMAYAEPYATFTGRIRPGDILAEWAVAAER